MSHFFRLIDNGIVDFFVQKAEDFCYCRHKFLKNTPYLLCNGELDCLPGYFPKKTSYCLVVAETPGNRKYVVLQTTQCCGCYLGGEAGALALPEAEIGLAILKHDFKSPVYSEVTLFLRQFSEKFKPGHGEATCFATIYLAVKGGKRA